MSLFTCLLCLIFWQSRQMRAAVDFRWIIIILLPVMGYVSVKLSETSCFQERTKSITANRSSGKRSAGTKTLKFSSRRKRLGGYRLNLPVHEHQVISQQSTATFRPKHFDQTPRVQSGIHVESMSQLVHCLRKRRKSYHTDELKI